MIIIYLYSVHSGNKGRKSYLAESWSYLQIHSCVAAVELTKMTDSLSRILNSTEFSHEAFVFLHS